MHLSVSAGQKRILPLLLGVFFITIAAGAQDLPNGKPESLRRTT
jgi:peptidoglycan/LPS O-acetylase OafA/YrhL